MYVDENSKYLIWLLVDILWFKIKVLYIYYEKKGKKICVGFVLGFVYKSKRKVK